MRRATLLLLVVSCSASPDFGFAVAVDIRFDFNPAPVTALDMFVDGDEHAQFHKTLARSFQASERWVYLPQPTTRNLTISGAARVTDVVGTGQVDVALAPGKTVEVTLELKGVAPNDLAGSDGAPLDLAESDAPAADLAPAACTIAGCAAIRKGCDPALGCVDCPALSASTSHFYVDAASFAAATGTIECPFNTITQGLNAAAMSSSVSVKTVHVAAGSYGSGETFPIEVPGNTTLDGAGMGATVISGGANDTKGLVPAPTTLVSDPNSVQVSTISNLSLRPASGSTTPVGILCFSGNAPKTYGAGYPAASTLVDSVELSGYEIGVFARSLNDNTTQSCNLLMTRSSIHDGHTGVEAFGCDGSHTMSLPLMVQLGLNNQPSSGNKLYNLMTQSSLGGVIYVSACVSALSLYENELYNSSNAAYLDMLSSGNIDIEHNQFHDLASYGLWLANATFASLLTANTFTRIGPLAPSLGGCHSSAVCLDGSSQVENATGNLIINNTNGLEITGAGGSTRSAIGFGDDSNLGGDNTIACNSNGTDGRDVWIHLTGGTAAAQTIWLDRNHWDHATPTTTGSDGVDLYAPSPVPMVQHTLIASPYPSPCDANHVK